MAKETQEQTGFTYVWIEDYEKSLGKPYRDWTPEEKMNFLKSNRETYLGMSWNDFLAVCSEWGFRVAYRQDYVHYPGEEAIIDGEKAIIDEEVILFNKQKGLLIYAVSFDQKAIVNSATLYGEASIKDGISIKEASRALWGCNPSPLIDDADNAIPITFHADIRKGFGATLSRIEEKWDFFPLWTDKHRFLWFLNQVENKGTCDDYEIIANLKISQMCPEARNMVGYVPPKIMHFNKRKNEQ